MSLTRGDSGLMVHGLCYGCFSLVHTTQNRHRKLNCTVCSRRHSTSSMITIRNQRTVLCLLRHNVISLVVCIQVFAQAVLMVLIVHMMWILILHQLLSVMLTNQVSMYTFTVCLMNSLMRALSLISYCCRWMYLLPLLAQAVHSDGWGTDPVNKVAGLVVKGVKESTEMPLPGCHTRNWIPG